MSHVHAIKKRDCLVFVKEMIMQVKQTCSSIWFTVAMCQNIVRRF